MIPPLLAGLLATVLSTLGTSGVGASAASSPIWPVTPVRILADFDPPNAVWEAGHRGLDLAAVTGDQVVSMTGGRVGFVGTVAGKPVVTVLLSDGRRVTYEPVHSDVGFGDRVEPGALLGTVAREGGHCGGRSGCLHVGLLRGDTYLNPRSLLRMPVVLKPWTPR